MYIDDLMDELLEQGQKSLRAYFDINVPLSTDTGYYLNPVWERKLNCIKASNFYLGWYQYLKDLWG